MLAFAKPKIFLLDDDSSFLDVAAFFLETKFEENANIKKFNHSKDFITEIENNAYLPEDPQEIIQTFYSSSKSNTDIEQTLKDLAEISAILIIDHHLHNETTNGIELSRQIKTFSPNSYIILLTAEVQTTKAIELHNNEIIDVFIRKDDNNPMESIYQFIYNKLMHIKNSFDIDPQDIFSDASAYEDQSYVLKRKELLNDLNYKSYISLNAKGDIALLNSNDQIQIYSYENKVFSYNG